MKLHEQRAPGMHLIGRYDAGAVHVEGRNRTLPLLVAPGVLREAWIPDITMLVPEALAPVLELQPRIVLLGAGRPPADPKVLRRLFAERQIALEIMELGAACRTYNVLAQEDRAVVALLFP